MAKFYTRAERRAYKEARQEQAALVANRLMGRKKVSPVGEDFFGGTQIVQPIQYTTNTNFVVNNPRMSRIISGMEGV